ncbi:MAG: hypothetical protein H6Q42_620, partial [Deltaproteobacteria bacterium]|nr:hypothetical protein [Deltaproteobacteria bacterium]
MGSLLSRQEGEEIWGQGCLDMGEGMLKGRQSFLKFGFDPEEIPEAHTQN